jgi:PAS domain S-box-containing protein
VESIPASVFLTTLLGVSRDGIIAHDAAGIVTAWNTAAARIFGVAEAVAMGRSIAHYLPGSLALIRSAGERGAPHTVTLAGVDVAGARMPLRLTLAPLPEPEKGGGVIVVHVPSQGDTRGTRGDQSGSGDWDAERAKFVLAASGMGDWSWDPKTDEVTLSARAAQIFDVPPDAPLSWTALREQLHPDDREGARLAIEAAIAEGSDYALEYRVTGGGRERWVSARGRCRFDGDGAVLAMLGVVQDITTDRLLVRVDDAVRSLVKPDDITFTAARVLGQHLRVNRCAYAFVEDDQDTFSLTGNYTDGVQSIVGRYRFRQFGAACLHAMRAGEPWVVEDCDGDTRLDDDDRAAYRQTSIRSVICVPITKAGRFVGAMAVHAQTTRSWTVAEVELVQQVASRCWESIERARVEREREGLLEAAEAANRAKDEFMAMLGHELRNPLAPMFTALHLMKTRGDTSFGRERAVIERQVTHLARLVDDLLDVSRIARGKVELKFEPIELAEVVTRAADVASPLLEQRSHVLTVGVPRHGLLVNGDMTRLVQVVSNLLNNAAKYTPHGGRIAVFTSVTEQAVGLHVRDTGVGMSPDVLARAFDLFVQGRQSIDRAHGGLGLGLTIVRSLVERHGGTVSAESAGPNLGSEFVVRLPRAHVAEAIGVAPAASLPRSAPLSATGARVLVVDDNEDGAQMLAAALASYGCEVHVAHDGLQALRIAAEQPLEAALLDIGLPVMDGYELAGRLRELPTLKKTWLVAVTGYGQASDRQRALAAGFEEHLVKPIDTQVLDKIVTKLSARTG